MNGLIPKYTRGAQIGLCKLSKRKTTKEKKKREDMKLEG